MYHFFTSPSNISKDRIIINGADVNHIKNVLRMKIGDELLISDGCGTDHTCVISEISDKNIICDIIEKDASLSEPSVRFYLFQGMPKADKFEHIIQKSVELGIYEIIPVITSRTVVKYDKKKLELKSERWQRIAEGAAKQSRRGIIPKVCDAMTFDKAIELVSNKESGISRILMPYENFKDMSATGKILSSIEPGMSVAIFVGPEGGFEEDEVRLACEHGAECISLGSRILRTETAPLMLLSVLNFGLELREADRAE